jgi:branched-chain amino acid transport system substrate-binding protein
VLIIDDDEAYSQGLVNVIVPILKKAGIPVDHQTLNGTDTGATLAAAIKSLVTSHLTTADGVTFLPWQTASQAQMFGQDAKQAGKTTILFGTDGTNSPTQFKIPGTYVSSFGPDISTSTRPLDKSIVSGVAAYGPYGPFGVPTYEAADVVMQAIHSVCASGQTPTRANVLAAVKKTNIPAANNVLDIPISFQSNGDLSGNNGYLFKINSSGNYVEIPPK